MRQKAEIAIRASAEESQGIPALTKAQGVCVFQLSGPIQHQTLVHLLRCPDLSSIVCRPDSIYHQTDQYGAKSGDCNQSVGQG